jgi:hypothetical protein
VSLGSFRELIHERVGVRGIGANGVEGIDLDNCSSSF